jgi:hypothetical protein
VDSIEEAARAWCNMQQVARISQPHVAHGRRGILKSASRKLTRGAPPSWSRATSYTAWMLAIPGSFLDRAGGPDVAGVCAAVQLPSALICAARDNYNRLTQCRRGLRTAAADLPLPLQNRCWKSLSISVELLRHWRCRQRPDHAACRGKMMGQDGGFTATRSTGPEHSPPDAAAARLYHGGSGAERLCARPVPCCLAVAAVDAVAETALEAAQDQALPLAPAACGARQCRQGGARTASFPTAHRPPRHSWPPPLRWHCHSHMALGCPPPLPPCVSSGRWRRRRAAMASSVSCLSIGYLLPGTRCSRGHLHISQNLVDSK